MAINEKTAMKLVLRFQTSFNGFPSALTQSNLAGARCLSIIILFEVASIECLLFFDATAQISQSLGFLMILEVAILEIGRGTCEDFEEAFREASPIIASIPGYVSHELRRCIEKSNRYILLVKWQTLEAHTVGFRQSADYQRWRALLHHFYDPFPTVEHYELPVVSYAV